MSLSCLAVMGLWVLVLEWLDHFDHTLGCLSMSLALFLAQLKCNVKVLSFWWLCLCNLESWSESRWQGLCCWWESSAWAVSPMVARWLRPERVLLSLCIGTIAEGMVRRLWVRSKELATGFIP